MKFWPVILLTFSAQVWARPLVLVSYYDPFGRASFNNSQRVAEALMNRFTQNDFGFNLKLCPLNTVFDKAYAQLEECMKSLPEVPTMVLGLGESTCDLKVELMMKNIDKTYGPDNEGNERKNQVIIAEAPTFLGLRYPLPQMYCALSATERQNVNVSNDAGTFVCNNTAFQMSYYYPEMPFGFIHVPAHDCRHLERKTESSVNQLEVMLKEAIRFINNSGSDFRPLPVTKEELVVLRENYAEKDKCLSDFFKRARPANEKSNFWTSLNPARNHFYKNHP